MAVSRNNTGKNLQVTVCILAGGLSTRMGRDKSRIRLGRRTMLGHIRATARELNFPIKIIRRDIVPRSGPIGGIYTGLRGSRADAVLFLACDMPFVKVGTLRTILRRLTPSSMAAFVCQDGRAGFPFVLKREACLPVVSQQIARSELSLQALANALKAIRIHYLSCVANELANINTPARLEQARLQVARREAPSRSGRNRP